MMKRTLKNIMTMAIVAILFVTSAAASLAAPEATAGALLYSHYTFDGGNYGNFGSTELAGGSGAEIGAFDSALLGNSWVGDHTNDTTKGLGKGFSSTNAVELANDTVTFDAFTASAWFACAHIDGRSNAGSVQRILGNGGYGTEGGWYVGVLVQNNGNTYIGCNVGGAAGHTEFIDVTASKGIYLGNSWHNVILAADRDAGKAYLYLDGEKLVDFDVEGSWFESASGKAYIGGYRSGDAVVEGFCGFISDVQSVNRVMTAEQVAGYCGASVADASVLLAGQFAQSGDSEQKPDDSGQKPDASGQKDNTVKGQLNEKGGVHFTFDAQQDEYGVESVGSVQYAPGRSGAAGDYALSLDGNSYLKLDAKNLALDKDFTVAFWTKMTSNGTKYDAVQRIFSTGVWGAGEGGFMVGFYNNRKNDSWSKLVTGVGSSNPNMNWSDAMTLLDDNSWHQVTAVFSGSTKKILLYFDGEAAGTYSYPADGNTVTGYLYTAIGGHLDANGVFAEGYQGLLDDVFVCDHALSAAQVKTLVKENRLVSPPKTSESAPVAEYTALLLLAAGLFAGSCGVLRRKKNMRGEY